MAYGEYQREVQRRAKELVCFKTADIPLPWTGTRGKSYRLETIHKMKCLQSFDSKRGREFQLNFQALPDQIPYPCKSCDYAKPRSHGRCVLLEDHVRHNNLPWPWEQREEILTTRETGIVLSVAKTLSNKEIAHELGISIATVKNHLKSAFEKLGVTNRTQLILTAIDQNLVDTSTLEEELLPKHEIHLTPEVEKARQALIEDGGKNRIKEIAELLGKNPKTLENQLAIALDAYFPDSSRSLVRLTVVTYLQAKRTSEK